MIWAGGLRGAGELGEPHQAGVLVAGSGRRRGVVVRCLVRATAQSTGSWKQQGPLGHQAHKTLAFSFGRVGEQLRLSTRTTGYMDSAHTATGLCPLAGQTVASGDLLSGVIICFWPRSVCPQGQSIYGASSQKWGQGGELCWSCPGPDKTHRAQTSRYPGERGNG